MDLNQEYRYDVESRLKGIIWVIAAFFIIVGVRLFYLQVIKGEYYRIFSENNSIKDMEIPALRGIIFDRNGEIVVDNRPIFDLVVIPQYISDRGELSKTVADIIDAKPEDILTSLKGASKFPPYKPYVIAEDVDMDTVSKVRARKLPFETGVNYNIDGVEIQYRYVRDYPEGDIASHILGYVREADRERLEKLEKEFPGEYSKGDYIGVNGIEERYDIWVRGEKGLHQKIVDALGREVHYPNISIDLARQDAKIGGNIYLTLDINLQRVAKRALAGKSGAVVAIDPADGAVLAMYSSPGYDLNMLSSKGRSSYWAALITDSKKPLFNRAIHGTYPPASTYKIVTAIAALEEGLVDKDEKINCHGGLKFGNRIFGCWRKSGHGPVNIIDAIAHSCDVYFYTMGLRLGIDRLAKYARLLGLGSRTGIELPGERRGLIPTTEWKLQAKKIPWNRSETLSAAIGQGYDLTTPIQMALIGAEVANGGYRVMPYLVKRISTTDGKIPYEWLSRSEKIEGISDETLKIVREGLVGVTEDIRGTARRLKSLNLKIAGKTGTAQVVGRESGKRGKAYRTHAWFVGYAPYDDPKIAVAVIVEHGGHGSSAAAPVVGDMIKEYLEGKRDVVSNNR